MTPSALTRVLSADVDSNSDFLLHIPADHKTVRTRDLEICFDLVSSPHLLVVSNRLVGR